MLFFQATYYNSFYTWKCSLLVCFSLSKNPIALSSKSSHDLSLSAVYRMVWPGSVTSEVEGFSQIRTSGKGK